MNLASILSILFVLIAASVSALAKLPPTTIGTIVTVCLFLIKACGVIVAALQPSPAQASAKAAVVKSASVIALAFLASCKLFGTGVTIVTPTITPVLVCAEDVVDAGKLPTPASLEDALLACGVAAADVETDIQEIEALASAAVAPGVDASIADAGAVTPANVARAKHLLTLAHRRHK